MEVVRPQLVPGRPPRPLPRRRGVAAFHLFVADAGVTIDAFARQESAFVAVVMPTTALLPAQHKLTPTTAITMVTPQRLLKRPPKAVRPVLVDSLEHQQHAADLKDSRAHDGGHAPAPRALPGPRARRAHGREQHEEPVEDPDHRPQCEYRRDVVRDVPDWVAQEHARDAPEGGTRGCCGPEWSGSGLVVVRCCCCCCSGEVGWGGGGLCCGG